MKNRVQQKRERHTLIGRAKARLIARSSHGRNQHVLHVTPGSILAMVIRRHRRGTLGRWSYMNLTNVRYSRK
jgi:hypothetical protein